MAENLKLIKLVEKFVANKCVQKEKKNFKIKYHLSINNDKKLGLLYDDIYCVPCAFYLNNNKNEELKELNKDKDNNKKEVYLNIKDYSFDLIFYKDELDSKYIKCNIIIIINDFDIIKELEENKEESIIDYAENKIIDINKDEKIIKKLRLFLYEYIKKNMTKDKNSFKKLFFENAKNGIKFFNDSKIENIDIDINSLVEGLKIKEEKNLEQILDELNPEIKEELIEKYIDEMPDEIVKLQKKYKKINFTKDKYQNYIDKKNNEV